MSVTVINIVIIININTIFCCYCYHYFENPIIVKTFKQRQLDDKRREDVLLEDKLKSSLTVCRVNIGKALLLYSYSNQVGLIFTLFFLSFTETVFCLLFETKRICVSNNSRQGVESAARVKVYGLHTSIIYFPIKCVAMATFTIYSSLLPICYLLFATRLLCSLTHSLKAADDGYILGSSWNYTYVYK